MIWAVARASWTQLKRDRAALALSFALPIVFFSIFAGIFGGTRDAGTRRVRLLVVDEDGTPRSERLLAALAAERALDLRRAPAGEAEGTPPPYDRAAAAAAVRAGDASVALVVPAGFGAAPLAFGPAAAERRARLELLADPADPIAPEVVQGLLQKVAFTGLGDVMLEGGLAELDRWAEFTPVQRERFAALVGEVRAGGTAVAGDGGGGAAMPIAVTVEPLLGGAEPDSLVAFYAAGLGVMFLLFTAAGAGGALIEERESGTLDRLLSTRLTMTQVLAGKLVYLTSLGVVQLAVMFLWGWAVFGLELAGHLPGLAIMAVATALACSAFGIVLAAVCRTRKQLVAVSNLLILSISALGGSMFPRFLMPEGLLKVSLLAFNSWALEGFLDVFWRQAPLAALVPEVAVLLAWTVVFFLLARRVARQWEVV